METLSSSVSVIPLTELDLPESPESAQQRMKAIKNRPYAQLAAHKRNRASEQGGQEETKLPLVYRQRRAEHVDWNG